MLRGETTGPPELAKLLAAASSGLAAEGLAGEEAAVAAFRETLHARPRRRRLAALAGLKAALIGLLVVVAGGITVAAASQHLPGPLGHRHSHSTPRPTPPRTGTTGTTPTAPSHPVPDPDPRPGHRDRGRHLGETPHPKKHPHPTKDPRIHLPKLPTHKTINPTEVPPVPGAGSLKGGG